ncbi:MAG: Gfo/Idh/MocA family oxidoreductase [Planctomycetota bacterium]
MAESRVVQVALLGGGMFGGDVVLRSLEDLERCGLAPYLGRVGLDTRARAVAHVEFRLVAVGTRTEASGQRICEMYRQRVPDARPEAFHGERPWVEMFEKHRIDIAFVATPDSLHFEPSLHALENGAHVMVEKPLTLHLDEADQLIAEAQKRGLIIGVDMHKRYDPCHRFLFEEIVPQIGTPLYGRAVLEEPLEVSTEIFRWAATSNPFSYVGVHWLDLYSAYLGVEPVSLHAVGQRQLLENWSREGGGEDVDTFDSMQVAVDYDSGFRVYYVNNWITPKEFEAPVNQEMEIVGTRGKIEFDQQYRGLRATITGVGTRTFNPHFTSDVKRPGGPTEPAYDGYGKDSIIVIAERAVEVILGLATRKELAGTYPDAESSRSSVIVVEAAAEVARRNLESLNAGQGTPFTARLHAGGYDLVGPGA